MNVAAVPADYRSYGTQVSCARSQVTCISLIRLPGDRAAVCRRFRLCDAAGAAAEALSGVGGVRWSIRVCDELGHPREGTTCAGSTGLPP